MMNTDFTTITKNKIVPWLFFIKRTNYVHIFLNMIIMEFKTNMTVTITLELESLPKMCMDQ